MFIRLMMAAILMISMGARADHYSGVSQHDLSEALDKLPDSYRDNIWRIKAITLSLEDGNFHKAIRVIASPVNINDGVCRAKSVDLHFSSRKKEWVKDFYDLMKIKREGYSCSKDEIDVDSYIQVEGLSESGNEFIKIMEAIKSGRKKIVESLRSEVYKKSKIIVIESLDEYYSIVFESGRCQFEVQVGRANGEHEVKKVNLTNPCLLEN